MKTLNAARSTLYRAARLLGDVNALASGNPKRIIKHIVNKAIGRTVVKRLWWR